jgi:hypothetical protein
VLQKVEALPSTAFFTSASFSVPSPSGSYGPTATSLIRAGLGGAFGGCGRTRGFVVAAVVVGCVRLLFDPTLESAITAIAAMKTARAPPASRRFTDS